MVQEATRELQVVVRKFKSHVVSRVLLGVLSGC